MLNNFFEGKMVIHVDRHKESMEKDHGTTRLVTDYVNKERIIQEVMHDDAPKLDKEEKINLNG
jgi:hypothetical protein